MYLRQVRPEDAELLYRWRNDPLTRENSRNSGEITSESHSKWLRATLANPRRWLLIAVEAGQSVGTIRYDWAEDWKSVELSWAIAPEHRGNGFGTKMVTHVVENFPFPIHAEIKVRNLASQTIVKRLGFHQAETRDDVMIWLDPTWPRD